MTNLVEREIDDRGVAYLYLNRPDQHNAMDERMIDQLHEACEELHYSESVRVVVLGGYGKSFCAGADLNWMKKMVDYSFEENHKEALALGKMLKALNELSKPTIAAVQGSAYGGGVGLTACCDIVLASESAKFCLSEVKLGLIPALISPYVIEAMGAQQARRYFLTAEVFGAEKAYEMGFVHDVVPDGNLGDEVEKHIGYLLKAAPEAAKEAKKLILDVKSHQKGSVTVDNGLLEELASRIAQRRISSEAQKGMQAFFEKKAPDWQL